MRTIRNLFVASILAAVPAGAAWAQDAQQQDFQGGNRRDRSFRQQGQYGQGQGQYGQGQNGQGQGQYGGDRQRNNGDNQGGGFNSRRQFNGGDQTNGNRGTSSSSSSNSTGSTSSGLNSTATPADVAPSRPAVPTGPVAFASQPLPKDFSILNSKSIFSRNHIAINNDAPKAPPIFKAADVAQLVLRGVMRQGDVAKANIEDTTTKKEPIWVVEGSLLTSNGARVTEITMDHIIVEKNGTRRMVSVTENLDAGTKVAGPSGAATPVAGSAATGASPTASASTASVKVTADGSATSSEEEVAEMMRRRRLAQLGQ